MEHTFTGWSIVCDRGCGCMFISFDSEQEAIDTWNTRQRSLFTPTDNRILAQKYNDLRKGLNRVKEAKIFKKFFSKNPL